MEREKDLLISLCRYLTSHGFPEESLAFEWKIGDRYRVDLAVIDPTTDKPVALFELKKEKSQRTFENALRQLESYADALNDKQVPTYIAFPREGNPPFELYLARREGFDSNGIKVTEIEGVPDYSLLKSSKIRKEIFATKTERKSALDGFQMICGIIAVGLVALLFLDCLEKVKLNTERLILIGAIISLIVVPVASKLKVLGLEFERYKKEDSTQKQA